MKYVIEHLDKRLFKWCLLEYKHISDIVGKGNVLFTNTGGKVLRGYGDVTDKKVSELGLKNICVLDPFAKLTLSAADRFDYLVFGGILGDAPMQGRTAKELTRPLGAESRNLGPAQFSTDTAVYVAKHLMDGGRLSDLRFQDTVTIEINETESVELPFRYVIIDGQPVLPDGLIEYLRKRKGF